MILLLDLQKVNTKKMLKKSLPNFMNREISTRENTRDIIVHLVRLFGVNPN